MGKIFVTNHNVGFWHAAIPVLRRLEELGHSFVAAAGSNAPSMKLIEKEGFELYELKNQANWNVPDATTDMKWALRLEKPDCIFVGCSDSDSGSEKTAVHLAKISGIPLVVLIENCPHGGLAAYETHDTPIYRPVAKKICVMNVLAQEKLLDEGYNPDQIVVTGNPLVEQSAKQKVVNVLKEFLH